MAFIFKSRNQHKNSAIFQVLNFLNMRTVTVSYHSNIKTHVLHEELNLALPHYSPCDVSTEK